MGNWPLTPLGGAGGMDLLWENPSPDAVFNAQIVQIPRLRNYKYALIGFRGSGGAISASIIRTDVQNAQYVICTEHVVFAERNITVGEDQITFGNAVHFSAYGSPASAQNNTTCVPIVILGIG